MGFGYRDRAARMDWCACESMSSDYFGMQHELGHV